MDSRQRKGLVGSPNASVSPQSDHNGGTRSYSGKSYGFSRRGIRGNFIPPIKFNAGSSGNVTSRASGKGDDAMDDSTKRWYMILSNLRNLGFHSLPADFLLVIALEEDCDD